MLKFRSTSRLLAPLFAGLALGACAPAGNPGGPTTQDARACFFTSQVNGFTEGALGDGRLYLRAGVSETFELQAIGGCRNLDWSQSIGLDPAFGGSRRCVGDTLRIIVPDRVTDGPDDRCLARVTRKLTPDEQRSLAGG